MGSRPTGKSQSSLTGAIDVPGPGTYKPMIQDTSSKFSLKGKHWVGTQIVITPDGGHEKMVDSKEQFPGPGTY